MERLTTHELFYDSNWPSTEILNSEQLSMIKDFNERVGCGEISSESVPCLCGKEAFKVIAEYDRYRLRQRTVICMVCGLIQSMPRMNAESTVWFYGSDTYRRLYDPETLEIDQSLFDTMAQRCHHRFDYVMNHLNLSVEARVMEIGCGGGWNLKPFADAGMSVCGLDPSPQLTTFGRQIGMDLRVGGIDNLEIFEDNHQDLIILSHVLEHFPNPITALLNIIPYLKPGGEVYIEVPDGTNFAIGALQNAHTYLFTPATLEHYSAHAGLKPNNIEAIGPHMRGLFMKSLTTPFSLDDEFDKTKKIIQRYERRENLKQILRGAGLFGPAKLAASVIRKIRAY